MTTKRLITTNLLLVLCLFLIICGHFLYRDTSVYTSGFSEEDFAKIKIGMPVQEVYRLLGKPLLINSEPFPETWFYDEQPISPGKNVFNLFGPVGRVELDRNGIVIRCSGESIKRCRTGMSRQEVLAVLGKPSRKVELRAKALYYSAPGNSGTHRVRILRIDENDRVNKIVRHTTHD